jgi:NAD(P)-dependent dehydrogenase (short-subunit alcohol dehydrogenase family)
MAMGQVEGKIALVTGGASGIGAACVETLAREGARVVISDIDDVRGAALAAQITASGQEAIYLSHDVTDEARWQEVVGEIERRYGRLDIMVANAGIGIMTTSIIEMSLADWRRQTAVNLDGVFLSVKHCIPLMRRPSDGSPGGGSIIMTSSIAGLRGSATLAGYCATKGGVRLFAKAIAMECASREDGIRVNSVHPGIIDTPIWGKLSGGRNAPIDIDEYGRRGAPLGRVGKPQDIANGVLFLASDAASYITGTELVIDGGITGGQITRSGPLAVSSAHE